MTPKHALFLLPATFLFASTTIAADAAPSTAADAPRIAAAHADMAALAATAPIAPISAMAASAIVARDVPLAEAMTTGAISSEAATEPANAVSPVVSELRTRLANIPADVDEKEREDDEALAAFYRARNDVGLWVDDRGLTEKAHKLIAELKNADSYGLDAKDFAIPDVPEGENVSLTTDAAADAEIALSRAALKYARYARGGRIPDPSEQLNSNLDRRPQWIDPKIIIDRLAGAEEPDAVLRSLQPDHEQFRRLREIYVKELAKGKGLTAYAKRIRANMEMWRWMWLDMGNMYVLNNIPEFMQYVYKDGKIIRKAKIVAGMLDKQSSIFSRPLKYVVLRPKWIVPESIKVKELWPSLIRGGGYMRQYGLQLETKDGQPLDYRQFDWTQTDIRKFQVTQPPGRRSVLGHVKFSFPSQHTIFMHDTPDKWMFRSAVRTLSHGCLRVDRPMELAEMVLEEDKGWDKTKIAELDRSGPLNNKIKIEKEIPIHLVYFTVWVDDNGRVRTFRDVYGHEKRITQALDGQWDKINKGRNHLAPVAPINTEAVAAKANRTRGDTAKKGSSVVDIISNAFGIGN
jgi:murein L,D-transpeptidase YcbB/YkuD